jgi:serine/threonine-protein kinase HipA
MELARLAGLEVPQTRAFEAEEALYFGVERFDRWWDGEAWRRAHVHTLGGLLHADFRVPSCDYEDLFKVTRALTRHDQEALYQVLRLMAFNWLSHNRDDHVKNVSFKMERTGEWRLAPVYDLTWSAGPGGEHSMTIAGEGRAPQRAHLFTLCERFDLDRRRCELVIDEVASAISQWEVVARSFDVSATTRSLVLQDLQRCARLNS